MVCLGHFHEVDFFLAWNTHAGNFCLAENWSRNMKKVKGLFLRNTGRRCVGFPLLLSPFILNSKNRSSFPWEENNITLLVAGMLNYSNKLLFLRERRMKDEGVYLKRLVFTINTIKSTFQNYDFLVKRGEIQISFHVLNYCTVSKVRHVK